MCRKRIKIIDEYTTGEDAEELVNGVFIKEDDFTRTQGYERGFEDGKNHVFELIKNKFDLGGKSDEL